MQKLSVVEKIGYSLGDLAANLIFQTLLTFITFFYTDIYGIPAGTAATIVLVVGWIGAFFGFVIGALADRTETRWGKFRPWVLWTAVPFGVFALLTFTTPDFNQTGKIIYAFVTYLLLILIYAANNLPYAALSGVLTGNMAERNSLSSYRFVAVMVAQFIIQALLLPLVMVLGDGDRAEGFRTAMFIFSSIGVVFFIITFLTTRERIVPAPEQHSTIGQDLKDLIRNKPWIIMLTVTVLVFITLALKGGMYPYYFNYYASEPHLAAFLEDIGFNAFMHSVNSEFRGDDPATSALSLFFGSGIICMIIGIGFSKPLADRFGKRNIFGAALFVSTLFLLTFYAFPPEAVGLMLLSGGILHGFFYGLTIPVLWAMIADVADYSEWKNNRRATAIIFSAMLFGLKGGLTIGSSLVGYILATYGYDPNLEAQNPATVNGIKVAVSIYASLPFLIAVVCLFVYEINKKMELRIESDLAARRNPARP